MKMTIISLVILSAFLLSGCSLIKDDFPAKQYLCAKGFVNCKVVAKFDNMESCQYSNRQRGWYCDSRDVKNIICVEKASDIADMYCSDK